MLGRTHVEGAVPVQVFLSLCPEMSQYYPITHELKTLFTAPRGKLATAGEQIDTPNVLIWVPAAGLSNSLNYESRGELKTIWRVSSVYSGYRRWVEFSGKLHASSRLRSTYEGAPGHSADERKTNFSSWELNPKHPASGPSHIDRDMPKSKNS